MRARLAIAVSGQTCELREVVLRDKPAELLQASPKGTVPVLVLPDGRVIDESLDIMDWALQCHDPWQWLADREAARHLIAQCDGPFKHHLDRYKYPNRYQLADGTADRDQGAVFLQRLQEALSTTAFLHSVQFGWADAAIAPFVRQFAHTDPTWFAAQPWPQLRQWLADFEASALFATVLHKYERWTPATPAQHFPAETSNKL